MDFLYFLFFSSLEEFGVLLFGLILFRIRLPKHLRHRIPLLSLIVASVSLLLRSLEVWGNISSIILLFLVLLLVRPLLKFGIKLTFLYVTVPLVLFIVIQALVIILMQWNGILGSEYETFSNESYLIQLITFVVMLLISKVTAYITEGFSFDPDDDSVSKKKLVYSNRVFLITISIALLLLSGLYYIRELISGAFADITLIVGFISSIIILFILYKRDEEESKQTI